MDVPSTWRSPLIITVPSLLNPSGNGSMNNLFPLTVLIWSVEIPILLIRTSSSKKACVLDVNPFSKVTWLLLASLSITTFHFHLELIQYYHQYLWMIMYFRRFKLSTFHWSTFLLSSRTATIPPSWLTVLVTAAMEPGVWSIIDV